jgi:transglutaminase-like putative cysteine protease
MGCYEMFWRRKGAKKKQKGKKNIQIEEFEELDENEDIPDVTGWTIWRKLGIASVFASCIGGIGLLNHHIESEMERKKAYESYVADVTAPFKHYPLPSRTVDGCLTPGSTAKVLRDSFALHGMQSEKNNMTVKEGTTKGSYLCIRPVDGGQDVELESKVRISRLDYGDVEGTISFDTGLRLVPKIPGILPHDFSVIQVRMNEKNIPIKYIEERDPAGEFDVPHYFIDIERLVDDGVLSSGDFDDDLEVKVRAAASIDEAGPIDRKDMAGVSAYDEMPDYLRKYTEHKDSLPSRHERIQGIVDAYDGDRDDVMAIMRYALDVTDNAIEYYDPELALTPIEVLDDGRGDCDDYAGLFNTILRGFGVPAREGSGPTLTEDGSAVTGFHAWSEVLVPINDGSYRWILVEPTWADNSEYPYTYINLVSPKYMYLVDFNVSLDTRNTSEKYEVFQEHDWESTDRDTDGDADGESVDEEG